MKNSFCYLLLIMVISLAVGGCGRGVSPVRKAMQDYMTQYPESQLCDVYKFCFQDYFGPEHLVSDSAAMADYILREIAYADSVGDPWQEPPFAYSTGLEGNFVRVDIGFVRNGTLTAGQLAHAFVESSKGWLDGNERSVEQWKEQWQTIQSELRKVEPLPKNFEEDSTLIAQALAKGQYAFHHSQRFNQTYHQHYRIIRQDIWKDLLTRTQQ